MKNNKILLAVFILLGLLSLIFLYQNKFSTIKEELKDFAVKDTANITKIFLADRNGKSITLTRKEDNQWYVNDKHKARRSNILNILEALYRVEIRMQVTKSGYNNVVKSLASSAIKCEVYLSHVSKPSKIIYIGGQTEDGTGTFMILENSSAPFIVQIPGFNGYLTPRFNPIEQDWKDPILFSLHPEEIKSIEIAYANFPENSFRISKSKVGFEVTDINGLNKINKVDSIACDNYLGMFQTVYYEAESTMKKEKADSIISLPPPIRIKVENEKAKISELDIYPVPVTKASLAQQDSLGNQLNFDVDRVYGYLKSENIFTTIQQQAIEKLFRRKSDFDRDRKLSRPNQKAK